MATSSNRRDDGGCDATVQKTAFDAPPAEFEAACKEAVANRKNLIAPDYVVRLDKESGAVVKVYADGRVESILD